MTQQYKYVEMIESEERDQWVPEQPCACVRDPIAALPPEVALYYAHYCVPKGWASKFKILCGEGGVRC